VDPVFAVASTWCRLVPLTDGVMRPFGDSN
jgi:hypothetical protein